MLEEAVLAFRAALEELTRERVPTNWAQTLNNLGSALVTLGEREGNAARLEEAVQAYRDALQELTQERVPLDFAITQYNLGGIEIASFDLTKDPTHLNNAETCVHAAREVFTHSGADHYIHLANAYLAEIASRR